MGMWPAAAMGADCNNASYKMISGLREIAQPGNIKAWLLDQFGVLHDGVKPYPGAIRTLESLASCDGKLVLLSNSSRRSDVTRNKLAQLGFDPRLFSGIITSGELTHQHLLERRDSWFSSLGRRCLHITWSARGAISLEGLNLEVVQHPSLADFILVHGTEALGSPGGEAAPKSLEEIYSLIEMGLKQQLPMIVANPDLVTVEARELRIMPGMLGRKYEEMGGQVRWMGKPDPVIYRAAELVAGVAPGECMAVGDSLEHDIKGAHAAGINSIFVAGGIHANELKLDGLDHVQPCLASLKSLLLTSSTYPTYVIPRFCW